MSGDIQPRKRKGKGKRKGHQQVAQLEDTESRQRPPKVTSCEL